MNSIEKKSFYSFLALYIFSSLLFLSIIGFIYYNAQKSALENESYYELQHIADEKGKMIITAQMKGAKNRDIVLPKGVTLALIDTNNRVVEGKLLVLPLSIKEGYYSFDGYEVLVSNSPMEYLNIAYVVVQSKILYTKIKSLQGQVSFVITIIFILISIIAIILSRLFMRPMHQKVEEIENFINDITHELNTPITALTMASNQALKDKKHIPQMLTYISISTRQLYDIYRSLSYLSFDSKQEEAQKLNIEDVLKESIKHYQLLCQSKNIEIKSDIRPHKFEIVRTQLQLIFSNLIGNAIKYSPSKTEIQIKLIDGIFTIKDEGIGIDKEAQKDIFKRFRRGTSYSGGFGVGLNIVESICREYDIELSLNSQPNRGSEFCLEFG